MADRCPWWAPPLLAVQFLTRIPVPGTAALSPAAVAVGLVRAVGWFPLVGTLVGAITAAVALGAAPLWPAYIAVAIALIVEMRLTGAFHEDAVADFCDGFGGGQRAEDILRIMKDSRIGSYGTAGLTLALGLRGAATVALLESSTTLHAAIAIVAAATFGRLVVVATMASVRPAPIGNGLAKDIVGGIGPRTVTLAVLTASPGLVAFLLVDPVAMLLASGAALGFIIWFRSLLLRRLGGSTGDCLGFAAYAGQLLLLLAAAAR